DKIVTSTVEWDDRAVLMRVIEERFLATRSATTTAEQLWERYFCESVRGTPTPQYLLNRVLPRPRDLILLCNAAVGVAINRQHSRVEEDDVLTAELTYSQFAFEALLVENGITVDEFESLLLHFLGAPAIMSQTEVFNLIDQAGF